MRTTLNRMKSISQISSCITIINERLVNELLNLKGYWNDYEALQKWSLFIGRHGPRHKIDTLGDLLCFQRCLVTSKSQIQCPQGY